MVFAPYIVTGRSNYNQPESADAECTFTYWCGQSSIPSWHPPHLKWWEGFFGFSLGKGSKDDSFTNLLNDRHLNCALVTDARGNIVFHVILFFISEMYHEQKKKSHNISLWYNLVSPVFHFTRSSQVYANPQSLWPSVFSSVKWNYYNT